MVVIEEKGEFGIFSLLLKKYDNLFKLKTRIARVPA